MGLNAGLYVIPAAKFAAAQAKGTWSRHAWHKCHPWFDIDKAWSEFNDVFQNWPPLTCAIEGDVLASAVTTSSLDEDPWPWPLQIDEVYVRIQLWNEFTDTIVADATSNTVQGVFF